MSSVINPRGPEEPSTYWRRRAVVLVVLLVVLWLLWMLFSAALGSNDEPAADSPSPTPSFGLTISPDPSASSPEASDPEASASPDSASASASASPTPSPSPSATGACRDGDIEVVAGTSAASTTVGAGLGVSMTVTTTGSAACTRDVGAGANELRITSGSVLVWSSDFCNPSDASSETVLEPGTPWSTSVTWPGTVTAKSCPADQPTAQPGTYRVVARNGTVESEPVVFTVR